MRSPCAILRSFLEKIFKGNLPLSFLEDCRDIRPAQRIQLLDQMVENSPYVHLITDTEGVIRYVNRQFLKQTGYAKPEIIGKHTRILNAGTQSKELYQKLWQTILAGETWTGELHNKRKNGELFWERTTISPIRDNTGNISHFVCVKQDITRSRDNDVALRDAYTRVKAAEEIKATFLNTMSHELRTPLNAIIGLSSVMLEEPRSEQDNAWLTDIQQSGRQLLKLIEDLFELTHCHSSGFESKPSNCFILNIVQECLEVASMPAKEKNLELGYEIDPRLPARILTESSSLKKALNLLISNAIRFTPKGFVRLNLNLERASDGESRIRFVVTDSGIGISPEEVKNIFQPFYQNEEAKKASFGGAGVGLSISKHLVEHLGGHIEVKSIEELGSEFSFSLPFESNENAEKIFESLCDPILAGKRIGSLLPRGPLQSLLLNITHAAGIKLLHAFSNPVDSIVDESLDLIVADPEKTSRGERESLESQKIVPVYWIDAKRTPYPPPPLELATAIESAILDGVLPASDLPLSTESNTDTASVTTLEPEPPAKLRILVVDDIAINLKVASQVLRRMGFKADTANGGIEFIEKAHKTPYDLVLLDLAMPDLDGHEAFERLKSLDLDHPLPAVVALTANTQDSTRERCLDAGMYGFITKPIDRSKLSSIIDELTPTSGIRFSDTEETTSLEPAAQTEFPPIIDQAHLQEICFELDRETAISVLQECYTSLANDFQKQLNLIENACREKDTEALIPVVHGLKGACASLGWQKSASLYESSLKAMRADAFSAYDSFPEKLHEDFRASSAAMDHYLESFPQDDE